MASSSSCSSTTRGYVRDARIASSSQGDGNWIAIGSTTVLLLREFDPGRFFTKDDEKFKKLSIELPSAGTGDRFRLGDDGVSVLLTEGSSAWAPSGGYCSASAGTGEGVIVERDEQRGVIAARLSLVLDCEWQMPTKEPAQQVRIDGEYEFREIGYDELTPWLGHPGPAGYRGFAVTPGAGR